GCKRHAALSAGTAPAAPIEAPERATGARVTMTEGDSLISVDYEVFGKVQGVFFRKYTQAEGKKLGLVGWVQNTEDGTVQGQIQGPMTSNPSAPSRERPVCLLDIYMASVTIPV
uniref:Acylphosphatase n=1 Tax=Chelonoidis abingdonii TaxID=106734 RepID=A0A8C0JDX5_CHEAB